MCRDKATRHAGKIPPKQRNGLNTGKAECVGSARIDDTAAMPTATGKAAQTLAHAREWIRNNPELWARFEAEAMKAAENGRRISVQRFIEDVRAKDRVNRIGEPLKVNNSFSPVFARILITDHPEVRPYIEVRRSPCFDEFFGIESGGVVRNG